MPEKASVSAIPPGRIVCGMPSQRTVGDLIMHEPGQCLHFAEGYGKPVLCPWGCPATDCVIELEDGDVVELRNIPKAFREGCGIGETVKAVHAGGWLNPVFKPMKDGIAGELGLRYEDLFNAQDGEEIEILVIRINDHNIDPGC